MRRAATLACCLPAWLPALAAQGEAFVRGGGGGARLVGPAVIELAGVAPAPVPLPAGDWAVHFGADAAGKPRSLAFAVPAAAVVQVAVAWAPPVAAEALPLAEAGRWQAFGEPVAGARVLTEASPADLRLAGTVAVPAGQSAALVARWLDAGNHYRWVWDRAADELRLERWLGGSLLVLGRAPAPRDDGPHQLALQVDGFRLQAWCDDALRLQALDGAHPEGRLGLAGGAAVVWSRAQAAPVAAPRASVAAVAVGHAVELHAATTAVADALVALEIALDAPHPALPRTPGGYEPWLLQRPAAPVLLRQFAGEVGTAGAWRGAFSWPPALAGRGHAALLRLCLADPHGEALAECLPPVPWWP